MSKNVLQMKYHAAKKEISFRRFQDDEEIVIKAGGALSKYVNMKGKFVLQDFGNTFFRDIARVFDGVSKVEIDAIMTKLDYEDLEQMIENYNQDPQNECTFIPRLYSELPDMKTSYEEVRKFGESAVAVLGKHRSKLFDIPLENDNVRESAESFAKQIDEEIKNINEKISSLSDNRVSLCFTGVYSAGKSALINALLGYKILPENIKSETAKMFRICSPEKENKEKIIFEICGVHTVLQWNGSEGVFEFKKGPYENDIRKEIQDLINEFKPHNKRKDEQIRDLLDKLNSSEVVSSEIRIEFPVPLDKPTVQFTIYDTPGTDSNYIAHQSVLTEALENQTQSILIFVAKPDGLEGSGNNALLNYLKEAERKNSKTSIDISRSLFVINKADGQTSDARKILQHQIIKDQEDGEFSIKLEDKKLFFTSALYGYVAKSIKNGTATPEQQALLLAGKAILATDGNPMSFCFRENRSASSEFATNTMISRCEDALNSAISKGDDAGIVEICSGLYALETEILLYGEKYAAAVKAFAIIDSVDKALAKLTTQANSLRESNQEEIAAIEKNIKELKDTISTAIESEYHNKSISTEKGISEEIRKRLKIDSQTLNELLFERTEKHLNKILKRSFFGLGKVKYRETDKTVIKDGISGIITDFTNAFMTERETLLTEERDKFIEAVQTAIKDNGNISDAAKKFFQYIPKPEINKRKGITNLDGIYNSNKRTEKIFFLLKQDHLDKKSFIEDVKEKLQTLATDMTNEYATDYQKALETILTAVKSNYKENLEKYSLYMQAMIENREEMQKLGLSVEEAADDLVDCRDDLNSIIWKEC
ncbi:MAG: dynamin family protein [Oribacterium sp.]|nr:dynamin family protein [Oribacterium sp.]